MAYYRQKGNKWYYTISYVDKNGDKHKIEKPGGYTKAEAKKAARNAMSDVDKYGTVRENASKGRTIEDLMLEWLDDVIKVEAKHNTARSYESAIRNHIIPDIGSMKLSAVTPKKLQTYLNSKRDKYGKGTLTKLTTILKNAFKYAVRFAEYLPTDPAAVINEPKSEKTPQKVLPFKSEHMALIFEKFPLGHQYHAPAVLSYNTGMRIGECLALKWEDIDFDNRIINVHKTMITKDKMAVIQESPKTSPSIRQIKFGQKLYTELKQIKLYQDRKKLEIGALYERNNMVCDWHNGKLFKTDNINYFNKFCRQTFGRGYSFHSFRHAHATMLLEAGEDLEIVSKRLGHSNINTTARVYSHVLENRNTTLVRRLDEIL